MNDLEILQGVKDVIWEEENFTADVFAEDVYGYPRNVTSEEACRWCIVGALGKVLKSGSTSLGAGEVRQTQSYRYLLEASFEWEMTEQNVTGRAIDYPDDVAFEGHSPSMWVVNRAIEIAKENQ